MTLDFLTPEAALVGLAVALPLLALAFAALRGGRARAAVGLGPTGSRIHLGPAAALCVLGALVAVAVAQPVLQSRDTVEVRTDAAAYVVVDTSRSMLAAPAATAENRLVRARRAALRIRDELAEVPVGVLSLSDRTLPHLFPSPDREAFASTLARAIRPGHPEPSGGGPWGTNLTALAGVPTENFFAPDVRGRAVFVITDGESAPIDESAIAHAYSGQPKPTLVVVRVGRSGEQVFDAQGRPERGYAATQGGSPDLELITSITGAGMFAADEAVAAARYALAEIGATGPTEMQGRGVDRLPLGAWALAVTIVPLAYLLRRRNVDL